MRFRSAGGRGDHSTIVVGRRDRRAVTLVQGRLKTAAKEKTLLTSKPIFSFRCGFLCGRWYGANSATARARNESQRGFRGISERDGKKFSTVLIRTDRRTVDTRRPIRERTY